MDGEVDVVDGAHDLIVHGAAERAPHAAGETGGHVVGLAEAPGDAAQFDGGRVHAINSSCGWKQRSFWPRTGSLIGGSRSHAPSARGQRVRKAQPAGRFRSDGVMPGNLPEPFAAAVTAWHAADQAVRVGMQRAVEHTGDRARFDDAAGVHHGDLVGQAGDHGEIVA